MTADKPDFYDRLAPFYHLIFPDWEASIARQAAALDAVIRALRHRTRLALQSFGESAIKHVAQLTGGSDLVDGAPQLLSRCRIDPPPKFRADPCLESGLDLRIRFV